MDSFFGRSGTMTSALDLANVIGGLKSGTAKDRLGSIVSKIMSLFL